MDGLVDFVVGCLIEGLAAEFTYEGCPKQWNTDGSVHSGRGGGNLNGGAQAGLNALVTFTKQK